MDEQQTGCDVRAGSQTISRDQFAEHNAKMLKDGRLEELWTMDTERVYHGHTLFVHLKPLIERTIADNEQPCSVDERQSPRWSVKICQTSRQLVPWEVEKRPTIGTPSPGNDTSQFNSLEGCVVLSEADRSVSELAEELTSDFDRSRVDGTTTRCATSDHIGTSDRDQVMANGIMISDSFEMLSKSGDGRSSRERIASTNIEISDNMELSDILGVISNGTAISNAEEAESIETHQVASPSRGTGAKQHSCKYRGGRKKQTLADRQRQALRHIETSKPYNRILHHLSVFDLPKEAMRMAKSRSAVGELVEDPDRSAKDERDMNAIRPYLESMRASLIDDRTFDECLRTVTRKEFLEHNRHLSEIGAKNHFWTHDGRRVYDAHVLQEVVLSTIKQYDRSTYDRCRKLPRQHFRSRVRFFSSVFQLVCKLRVLPRVADEAKRRAAVGRLTRDPEEDRKDKEEIRNLIRYLDNYDCKTEIIDDLAKCATRHYDTYTWKTKPRSASNDVIFQIGTNVDVQSFRQWPDYIWHDRDSNRKWKDDWTSFPVETCDERIFDDGDLNVPCLYTSWRDDWPAFDTDIDGEAPWDIIPVDVVKEDLATETQLVTWQRRERRPNRKDPERMARIRQRLFDRFRQTYGYDDTELAPYEAWYEKMAADWQTFAALCTSWHPGYVQARRDPEHCVQLLTEPILRFLNPEQIARRQYSIMRHFLRHKYVRRCDPEQCRRWSEALETGWQRFQELCQTWTPADVPAKYRS